MSATNNAGFLVAGNDSLAGFDSTTAAIAEAVTVTSEGLWTPIANDETAGVAAAATSVSAAQLNVTTTPTLEWLQVAPADDMDDANSAYALTDNLPYQANSSCPDGEESSFDMAAIATSLPAWTFVTLAVLLTFIHYLRHLQRLRLFEKCTSRNAHFRYDFHVVVGRQTASYAAPDAHLIIDLLDAHLVSTMTVQVPGATLFNETSIFTYQHSRPHLRCLQFSIMRRHPIRDVRCIRVAHSCANQDAKLLVYGVNVFDVTNSENKFFPINAPVKYRGTQWALNTTFEPRNDTSFAKLGADCYDPFSDSRLPSYLELLVFAFYLVSAVFAFSHLIGVAQIAQSIALHAIVIIFVVGSSTLVLAIVYFRLIKAPHIIDQQFDSSQWYIYKCLSLVFISLLATTFLVLAFGQTLECQSSTIKWLKSSGISLSVLASCGVISYIVFWRRKVVSDNALLDGTEANVIKLSSQPQQFEDNKQSASSKPQHKVKRVSSPKQQQAPQQAPQQLTQTKAFKTEGSGATKASQDSVPPPQTHMHTKHKKSNATNRSSSKQRLKDAHRNLVSEQKTDEETLETAFGNPDSASYMKTKNKNSISQYA